ncbi:MAG: replication-associated recombination protein A [Lentisphaerae bacterium]|nr:replication-associated recombination protein A [Lentisphaerota bacterium]
MNELEFNFGNPAAEPSAEGRFGAERMPLAARMRPRTLEEYCGQSHILAPGKLLRRAIDADNFSSIILSGPPGVGKTSLAELIANTTDAAFVRLSGVTSTVADIRREIVMAKERRSNARRRTILFVDEIHRFNRAQQDSLLPDVESGVVRLIGATTFNPTFYVVNALMSRSLNFQLEPLAREDIKKLLTNALTDERGFGKLKVELAPEAMEFFAEVCEGDGRRSLNALEMAVLSTPVAEDGVIHVDLAVAEESVQKKVLNYDDDAHYDTASAFIKSMRGSDPDAAVYYLAKMLHAGEDIRFIARRMVILASEDIGNADPRAITLATSAMQAVDLIGMPEARIILAQAATYLATAPKSNAAYMAINEALEDVQKNRVQPIPYALRDPHSAGGKANNHGKDYVYPHAVGGFAVQDYLSVPKKYYQVAGAGYEAKIKERLDYFAELRRAAAEKAAAGGENGSR